jgi:hypothetical protein
LKTSNEHHFLPQDVSASSVAHALCAASACNLALLSSHCNQAVASALPSIVAAVDSADLLVRRTALLALTSAAHSHTSWLTPQLTAALMEVLLRHVKLDESLMRQVIITPCSLFDHDHYIRDLAAGFNGTFQD